MQSILIISFAAAALAAPQNFIQDDFNQYEVVPILQQRSTGPVGPLYDFFFQTGDGVTREEVGQQGPLDTSVSSGNWEITYPDGSTGRFDFRADENGFYVESPRLPVGPEMPAHALEQIRKGEEENAAGIFHDGQWDPIRYARK